MLELNLFSLSFEKQTTVEELDAQNDPLATLRNVLVMHRFSLSLSLLRHPRIFYFSAINKVDMC